jgi:hypothetical protein
MAWAKKHPVEVTAEWVAPALLAAAASWAAWMVGLSLATTAAVGVVAVSVAIVALRLSGGAANAAAAGFEPVPIEGAASTSDELLLDDPLVEIADDSRVVRLFARAEPTPGELVLRIEDYLNDGRRAPQSDPAGPDQRPADASAALHAALANIRASLR